MGIGDFNPRKDASEKDASLEDQPARKRNADRGPQESRAKSNIRLTRIQGRQELFDLLGGVLTIGIEGDDPLGASAQGEADAGLQCGTLAEVDDMPEDPDSFGVQSHCAGVVLGAIVHDGDIGVASILQTPQRRRQPAAFVEGGDDDPYIAFRPLPWSWSIGNHEVEALPVNSAQYFAGDQRR